MIDIKDGCGDIQKDLMEEVFLLKYHANIDIKDSLSLPIYIRKMLVRRITRNAR